MNTICKWSQFVQFEIKHYIWTNIDQMGVVNKYSSLGEQIRKLREETGQTLKIVANNLEIDISLLAKIERNERQPTKSMLNQLAEYFKIDSKLLQIQMLSDQIASKVISENIDESIFKVAEEKVKYLKNVQNGK